MLILDGLQVQNGEAEKEENMMKVSVLGYGTVGSGVVEIIRKIKN